MIKTVIEIVEQHLQDNGYDGLVSEDFECGCAIDDLAPCGEMKQDCVAAHRVKCHEGQEFDHLFFAGTKAECGCDKDPSIHQEAKP